MEMTPELRERFLRFREVYEARRLEMVEEQASGRIVATEPYKAAQHAVPLSPDERHLYKKLAALHSVNGGELFAILRMRTRNTRNRGAVNFPVREPSKAVERL